MGLGFIRWLVSKLYIKGSNWDIDQKPIISKQNEVDRFGRKEKIEVDRTYRTHES